MTASAQHELPSQSLAELRRGLLANGYVPVPVDGKRPKIKGWSSFRPKPEQIDGQIRRYSDHNNTGILCGDVVAVDIDVPDICAAEHLRTMVLALPGADSALQRIGRAPKVTFIFRASDARRKKITGKYIVNGHETLPTTLRPNQGNPGWRRISQRVGSHDPSDLVASKNTGLKTRRRNN
ncbi:bifunctional DNA primase/polymerase [Ensifer adhaerens]